MERSVIFTDKTFLNFTVNCPEFLNEFLVIAFVYSTVTGMSSHFFPLLVNIVSLFRSSKSS